jgi:signal transduction histidine kinase/integral membrane sensor domain MASE1
MHSVALRVTAVPQAARLVVLALAYFSAAKASLVFAIPPGYATAVWLPSGIAVAAVVLWGARCWPGLWLGAALANFTINLSVPAALGIATGNTLEALCAGWLVAGLLDRDAALRSPEAVFQFAAVAALCSVIAASAGIGALHLVGAIGEEAHFANWYTWWQGDTTGILVVAPCVLAWAGAARSPQRSLQRQELTVFGLLFGAALLAVFARAPADDATRAIAFLTMPFFAWAACRYDPRVVGSSVLLAAALAVWCTVNGRGPFAGGAMNESLLTLQAFVSTAALIAWTLSALTRARERALRTLRVSHDSLDEALRAQDLTLAARDRESAHLQALAHVGVWAWDSHSGRMTWSDELCRIHGIEPGAFVGGFDAYLARVDARDRDRMRALLQGALHEGRPWEAMERIVRDDGSARVLHSFGRVARRARGGPARMKGFCVDVSGRVRLEQIQATLHEVGLMLAQAPGVEAAVPGTLRILCDKLDWQSALYWRAEEGGARLHALAAHPAGEPLTGMTLATDSPAALPARAWRERRPVWNPAQDSPGNAFALPVVAGRAVLGVIELRGGARFEPVSELLEMATSLGALLGGYLFRTRSDERLRALEVQRRALLQRLLDAQDAERRQVAAELRDAIARPLAAAHADLGLARLDAPLAAARELISQLRPASLEDYGLLAALRTLAARFERRTGIAVAVIGAEDAAEIAPRLETALFQIARDALDNVARHARAHCATIALEIGAGGIALSIRDDGAGFDARAALTRLAGGLALMRERAEAAGGQLRVESAPGTGTRVSVCLRG